MVFAGVELPRSMRSLASLVLAVSTVSAEDASKGLAPIDTGMVEQTGVALLLLDVRVTDDHGQPLRGLTRADFKVALDGRDWTVESADDLCPCADEHVAGGPAARTPATSADAERPATSGSSAAAPLEPVSFVLHFDFSQLQLDGRAFAIKEGERWVRETMQPEDRVMVTAFGADAGLVVLADFTGDKERLAVAIQEAYKLPALRDPFPEGYDLRLGECIRCCKEGRLCSCQACWIRMAGSEYLHSKGSLKALRTLLERMQAQPGRKALLLFNQRGSLFPTKYYPVEDGRVGDHVSLVDEIAAEASLGRTAIYTAFAGTSENPLASNLGANLADMTGGRHSKRLSELSELTGTAGRGCDCIYRLGLTPPESERHVYRVNVEVKGRRVDASYRVMYLSEADRWMRATRAVLAKPASVTDIVLASALVPIAGRKNGWDLKVQIAVDPQRLELLPAGSKTRGNWEVGALLTHAGAEHTWEMLGVSELRSSRGDGAPKVEILHERAFEGLPPGLYQLRAFVRDRWANLYGSDLVELELPDAQHEGLAGPVVLRVNAAHLPTSLPLRERAAGEATRDTAVVKDGTLPLSSRSIVSGEPLDFLSWVCPGKSKDSIWNIQRYVSLDEQPLFRFEEATPVRAGDCAALRDRLDTSTMSAGRYTYHVRWRRVPDAEPEHAKASFVIEHP